ncbi:MAG: sigma-70 family RNA polymerase sigma factor [Chloroflexi bacterium]|nr:sigma-70 family RNA polymerase sigma factor [Chloroflexota bacterium]
MTPRESDEMELVRSAASEAEAFGELYNRHVTRIYSYIYYRTGDYQDAEDLTARVFQRALRHVGNFQDQGVPFSAWLYRIAHNLVANWHRDRSRRPVVPLEDHVADTAAITHPEALALAEEQNRTLLRAVRKLPPDRQQLLILKFVERLPNAEIGQIMGRTEGAIKSLYHRTLNSLRDQIKMMEDGAMGNPD